jgi:hypothetical protein
MSSTLQRSRLVAVAAGAIVVGALAGCTPGDTHPTTTPAHVNGLPDGVQQATSVPTDVPNTPSLRANVAIADCSSADGGWKAAGTAKNPGKSDVTYTISVFFTTDHGTVLGNGGTTVAVGAGKTAEWSVTAQLTAAPKTLCVLRGVG